MVGSEGGCGGLGWGVMGCWRGVEVMGAIGFGGGGEDIGVRL